MGETYYEMFRGKNQKQGKGQYPCLAELHTWSLQSVLSSWSLFLTFLPDLALCVEVCGDDSLAHSKLDKLARWKRPESGKTQGHTWRRVKGGHGIGHRPWADLSDLRIHESRSDCEWRVKVCECPIVNWSSGGGTGLHCIVHFCVSAVGVYVGAKGAAHFVHLCGLSCVYCACLLGMCAKPSY